jgi:hypothetical protein
VFFVRHYLDRFLGRTGAKSAEDAAAIVMASAGDDADRAQLERVEHEWIVGLAEKVQMLEARRADVEAGIVRKCGPPAGRTTWAAERIDAGHLDWDADCGGWRLAEGADHALEPENLGRRGPW